MKTPKLSIIVPVYNLQNYIGRCINSIVRQKDSAEYEIIIVNDGSSDNTPRILDNFAKHYKNIKVIHQANAGVSVARNTGITASHGRYITFVDGDDMVGLKHEAFNKYFTEDMRNECGYIACYENDQTIVKKLSETHFDDKYFVNMLNVAYNTDADIVLGGKIAINTANMYMLKEIYEHKVIRGTSQKDKNSLLIEAEIRESANFALFSHDMLNTHNLRFSPNMQLDEDILFCQLAILHAKTVVTAPNVTYFYNNHINSLSCISSDEDNFIKYHAAYLQRFHILLNKIIKQPKYMTKDIFGGLKNLFIDKYETIFDTFTIKSDARFQEKTKYCQYECKESGCNKDNCTQCCIAHAFLNQLQSDYKNLAK